MESQLPLLVAHDRSIGEDIKSQLKELTGLLVRTCSYDDYRDLIAWHRPGVVFLTADGDECAAKKVVQEAQIRCSPVRISILQLGSCTRAESCPENYIEQRHNWPGDASRVAERLSQVPTSQRKESLTDVLANRLMQHTPSLLPQLGRLALAAAHDITVLLTGETGTGKTYLARLIHEHSPRKQHPFLMVPCGAQPTNLFESTFFGHVKGAFTGAHQTRIGRFAAAGKGTILLDEIDALGLEQQASLLRVIETGEYELVGGNETLHSEARIIVASNSDLAEEVAKDLFRQDLFYRLNVMSFYLAPLRRRRQDIPLLARGIVARFNAKFDKELYSIAPDALAASESYNWPGNIRQLENVLQEAVLTSSGPELLLRHLPELPNHEIEMDQHLDSPTMYIDRGSAPKSVVSPPLSSDTLLRGRAAYESALIQKTLGDCRFIRSRAARALGVSRVTLYKKMKQYGLTDLPRQ